MNFRIIIMAINLNVMTFNVGNGRADPARLVACVRTSQVDIVALQEVSHSQGDALEKGVQDIFSYRSIYPGGFAGKAILSRFPISESVQIHNIPDRPDLKAVIDLEETQVTVIAAHPSPPRFHRTGFHFDAQTISQINALAEMANRRAPSILLGDFNLVKRQSEYKIMVNNELKDAFQESGSGFGYTLPRRVGPWRRMHWLNRVLSWVPLIPAARVDYIWYTETFRCNACWVGQDAGSDHLPVLAKLVMG
jgi:endonuclease/exonuclease/phosphatase family metal-dependent hydrolase